MLKTLYDLKQELKADTNLDKKKFYKQALVILTEVAIDYEKRITSVEILTGAERPFKKTGGKTGMNIKTPKREDGKPKVSVVVAIQEDGTKVWGWV